ncbi:hypothetical protein [Syntrophotalea carbinolica]|uniref:hypothetical protein n=1 Tax=Syntrophotalea carbinolica TaxID=19 RepID=UPI0011D131F4|nr:hypothetical protein [Syntrophotalea carbinolica]
MAELAKVSVEHLALALSAVVLVEFRKKGQVEIINLPKFIMSHDLIHIFEEIIKCKNGREQAIDAFFETIKTSLVPDDVQETLLKLFTSLPEYKELSSMIAQQLSGELNAFIENNNFNLFISKLRKLSQCNKKTMNI